MSDPRLAHRAATRAPVGVSDEPIALGSGARSSVELPASRIGRRERLGGTHGNEVLTSATAAVLTFLLLAEGATILFIGGLLSEHMFIGLVLIPPVALKLASTGYRFARYYTGSQRYLEKGPPPIALRLLAPVLVAATVMVFASGVWLMLLGHKSDNVLLLHKASFIVWGAVFGIHFLAHLPRMFRSLRGEWTVPSRRAVPGSYLRAGLVTASIGAGLVLALSLLSLIAAWHGVAGG